jgi:hypothetical protein
MVNSASFAMTSLFFFCKIWHLCNTDNVCLARLLSDFF